MRLRPCWRRGLEEDSILCLAFYMYIILNPSKQPSYCIWYLELILTTIQAEYSKQVLIIILYKENRRSSSYYWNWIPFNPNGIYFEEHKLKIINFSQDSPTQNCVLGQHLLLYIYLKFRRGKNEFRIFAQVEFKCQVGDALWNIW